MLHRPRFIIHFRHVHIKSLDTYSLIQSITLPVIARAILLPEVCLVSTLTHYAKIETLLPHLDSLPGTREVSKLLLHHTWNPSHAEWHGLKSMNGMMSFWYERQKKEGWHYPPGGHFVAEPNGGIFQAFALDVPLNASSQMDANKHGIALETVGNFDTGHDRLEGDQAHTVIGLLAGLCVRYGLQGEDVFFHRNFTNEKSCPGTGLDRAVIRQRVTAAIPWARVLMGQ